MKKHFEKMVLGLAMAGMTTLGSVAMAQGALVENFEAGTLATEVMFQEPSFSGSTTGIAAGSSSLVVDTQANDILDPAAGAPGTKSVRVFAEWSGATGGSIRLSTSSTAVRPNPRVLFNTGVGFYVKITQGQADIQLQVRETEAGGGPAGVVGDNAGGLGGIERSTSRTLDSAANSDWQYVHFNLPTETWTAFAGTTANGTLEGASGSFESIRIVQTGGAGPIELFIDDIYNGPAQTPNTGGSGCPETDAVQGSVTVDGTKDANYGTALALQTVATQFGDANDGNLIPNGNELAGLYVTNNADDLFVMLTGNLSGDNAIVVFFDVVSDTTGANVTPDINPSKDGFFTTGDGYGGNAMPDNFNADLAIMYKHFNFPTDAELDYVYAVADFRGTPSQLETGNLLFAGSNVSGPDPVAGVISLGGSNYRVGINNTNIAGVTGFTAVTAETSDPAAAALVNTGVEFSVPLSELGAVVGDSIQVWAVLSGGSFGGATYVSNQTIPSLAVPRGNIQTPADAPNTGTFNWSSTGYNITPACYVVKAGAAAATSWEMYE